MNNKKSSDNGRVYTTHGVKKNQGMLANVNGQPALCYTEGKDNNVVGYTLLIDLIQQSCQQHLPTYQLEI